MGLTDQAKQDVKKITSDLNGFGVVGVMTSLLNEQMTINGLFKRHHLNFNEDGDRVNVATSSFVISESNISNYTYLNGDGEIALSGHKIVVDGENYIVSEFYPDQTLDLIVLILSLYE